MTPADLVLTPRGLRYLGRYFPCATGRGGLTGAKREGDLGTPRGLHRITGCLYRPDRLPAPNAQAIPIRPGDRWCDDPEDAEYNQLTRTPSAVSIETLRRADPLYDIVLTTDWNWPDAQPYKGSAIFLHQWRKPRHPTAGCLAFRRDHLAWIAAHIVPGTRLIIA